MHYWALASALALALAQAASCGDVFVAGEGGYHTYRIPALLVTQKGTVLAFCEGRKSSGRDDGDIDLLLRRSGDGGRTWGPVQVVHEEGGTAPITIGNPAPVEDRKSGVIHLLFTRNNQRVFTVQSRDDGKSWSDPIELTDTFKSFEFPWKRFGAGPGHAIQLRSGRLLVPVWLNDEIRKNYRAAAVYSDDNGKTWKAGGIVPPSIEGANECMLFERADGTVAVNFRSRERRRSVSVSKDGGETWSEPRKVEALADPVCQGSVLAVIKKGKPQGQVVFANPANEKARARMTLRLSKDGGETWPVEKVLHEGPAAYSDLAVDRKGNILCLYERGEQRPYERIWLERVGPGLK